MTHPTHKTRFSDSSLYDEVCTRCGCTDAGELLRLPCEKVDKHAYILEKRQLAKENIQNSLTRVGLKNLWLPVEYADSYVQYLLRWENDGIDLGHLSRSLGFYDAKRRKWGQQVGGVFAAYKRTPTHFHEWPGD